ncbi:MAG TPA: DUF559 domain-containing protein [Solirubrobacter sp.]|nr:DUF559 domain-containing protein [Solirubrobacter sp.]
MRSETRLTGDLAATPPPDRLLAAIAADQHGLLTVADLAVAGLDHRAVGKRVARGVLHRRHRGVYSLVPGPLAREAQWMAAVLAAGPGAVLGRLSVAELHGFTRTRAPLIAVLAPGRRIVAGATVHRYRSLDARDTTCERHIPSTTVHRMFVDLTDVLEPLELTAIIHEAAFRGRFVEAAVRDAMARARGRHRLAVLERAIELYRAGSAGLKSRGERAFLRIVRALPVPRVNAKLLGDEVDFHWPVQRLVVEVDGAGHERPPARADDGHRDAALRAAGYAVLRFTEADVYLRPDAVRRDVAAALASSRAPPHAA